MAVSVREVAERAGVSVGTVSNVLNGKVTVRPATVDRVLRAVDELGFVRNDAARQLRAGVSRSIGMIVLDTTNPFFSGLARSAEKRAMDGGRVILLGSSDEQLDREELYLDLFEQQRVAGLLITPADQTLTRLERLHERGMPVVLVDRIGTGTGFSSVSGDDVAGGRTAVAHLLASGRRHLAFVGGPKELPQVQDRLEGAREAIREHTDARLSVATTRALSISEGRRVGERLLAKTGADAPDALFAANDLVAIGLLDAATAAGRTVPGDVAIVGYDDIPFTSNMRVPLSSVRQPYEQMGVSAVELLEREIAGGPERDHVVFEPELVVRDSSAA